MQSFIDYIKYNFNFFINNFNYTLMIGYTLNFTISYLFNKIIGNRFFETEKIQFPFRAESTNEYTCLFYSADSEIKANLLNEKENYENINFRFIITENRKIVFILKQNVSIIDKIKLIIAFLIIVITKKLNNINVLLYNIRTRLLQQIFIKHINPEITKLEYNK